MTLLFALFKALIRRLNSFKLYPSVPTTHTICVVAELHTEHITPLREEFINLVQIHIGLEILEQQISFLIEGLKGCNSQWSLKKLLMVECKSGLVGLLFGVEVGECKVSRYTNKRVSKGGIYEIQIIYL